jgi:ZIP family zinc transporter
MLASTMMPEAYEEGGEVVGIATAAGFLLSFILSHLE